MSSTVHNVDLWSITAWREHPSGRSLLAEAERERADSFRCPTLGHRWSYFHSAIREILSLYSGTKAAALSFAQGHHGKPQVSGLPELHFNLSHSNAMALLAVSRGRPVGVDIEHRRALKDMDKLAQRCFSPTELAAFREQEGGASPEVFFRLWTRKEAIIKASGLGLQQPLHDFDVPANAITATVECRIRTEAAARHYYALTSLVTPAAYTGAVALEVSTREAMPTISVRYLKYSPGETGKAASGNSTAGPLMQDNDLSELCT